MNRHHTRIDPDEIFLDSKNLPSFDTHQFEGRLERPISARTFFVFGSVCILIGFLFFGQAWNLQINNGTVYAEQASNNSLKQAVVFASRGTITDRNGVDLAWNIPNETGDAPERAYITQSGFGQVLGFIKYPAKDSSGFYYREAYEPQDGAELAFDERLAGKNGLKLTEVDVAGNTISESTIEKPVDGEKVALSIDARIQEKMYAEIQALAEKVGFRGGAGILMDLNSGELLTSVSYPEFEPSIMTSGNPTETIQNYSTSSSMPFLNRVTSGLYTPGSIIKPFLALAALEEKVITPEKQIVSTGKLVVPNPYYPDKPSIFLDWKAHGAVDMRHAIAVSSDVYFYEIGGGFGNQLGLGISRIEKYLRMFGFGTPTGIAFNGEEEGNIPNPQWKQEVFGENWLLGNTYHTAIGQYGMQVTPLQAIRGIAALGNGGTLVTPTVLKQATTTEPLGPKIPIKNGNDLQVVQEGMRLSITEGTSVGLNVPYLDIAGKTGTAELGASKDRVNSWSVGYFPYEHPRYAYLVVMESGPRANLVGATYVMRQVMDFMHFNTPEYLED